ncbi:hypothetical protein RvY_11670 [Ramazzottius varieornatus]|uniref:Uncharacterized protein n=1 Tax=Ramazzottius varieornatus TaxID=947166 RepID=A0A1D1VGY2_RAMVA|nr:hypothetical protein RvY_11670 [Ramazzottius varieornatus]
MYSAPVGSSSSNQPQHPQAHYANHNSMVPPNAYYPPPQSPQQQHQSPQHAEQYSQPQKDQSGNCHLSVKLHAHGRRYRGTSYMDQDARVTYEH